MMEAFEESWWYAGRLRVVSRVTSLLLDKNLKRPSAHVLDMGAGFGGMHALLAQFGQVDAYEPDPPAREELLRRGYVVVHADLPLLLENKYRYECIGAFDVLEHIEDDRQALGQWNDLLAPGGVLLLSVPAFRFLWSQHDVDCHHFRRYNKKELCTLLEAEGFSVSYATYWNMLLFLPAALSRKLGLVNSQGETTELPRILDFIFRTIINIESLLVPFLSLPFGTGIILVARKK